jgi:Tol biopolymer transport system component
VPRLGGTPTLLLDNAEEVAFSPSGDRIAFARIGPSGQRRIHVVPITEPERILTSTNDGDGLWEHTGPAWSPDGQTICYAAARDLWLLPANGGKPSRLTTDNQVDFEPAWSPDGRYVYFSSYREGTLALWRVPARGGTPQRLTVGTGPERHPSISGDGTRLVYTTFVDDPDLVLRDLTKGVEQRLAGLRDEHAPTFAPDGRAIAFVSDRLAGHFDLWLQPISGSSAQGPPRRLTDHEGSAAQPAYSPDGKWIAYHRVVGSQRDVWIVSSGGGVPIRFTDDPAVDVHPDWSPDGSRIAFVSERSGGSHIWVAPVRDGRPAGPASQVTSGKGDDQAPCWSPDGSQIAFVSTSPSGESEVWIVEAAGRTPPRQLTKGAEAQRARWSYTSDWLFVSGLWGTDALQLRRIPQGGGPASDFDPPITLDTSAQLGHFDVTRDGRLLVFARSNLRGDIWLMRSRKGTY